MARKVGDTNASKKAEEEALRVLARLRLARGGNRNTAIDEALENPAFDHLTPRQKGLRKSSIKRLSGPRR